MATRIRCVWPRNCMSAPCSTTVSTISSRSAALIASPWARCASSVDLTTFHVERGERRVDGVDEILAQVGHQAAERVGEPRPHRHQHLGDAELARDRHGVQRPGPAEGEQHEVARVVAARQRDESDGAGHVRVGEPEDGGGGILDGEAERPRQPVADDGAHGLDVHGALDRRQPSRIEPAEHQVGVGDGGLGAAAAVADRPRRRAGRTPAPPSARRPR